MGRAPGLLRFGTQMESTDRDCSLTFESLLFYMVLYVVEDTGDVCQ